MQDGRPGAKIIPINRGSQLARGNQKKKGSRVGAEHFPGVLRRPRPDVEDPGWTNVALNTPEAPRLKKELLDMIHATVPKSQRKGAISMAVRFAVWYMIHVYRDGQGEKLPWEIDEDQT